MYIRENLIFKEGTTRDNIDIWYNTTRWHFSLHAPFLTNKIHYRISLIGNGGESCMKSMSEKYKILDIYCKNNKDSGILMHNNIQLLFYTFQNSVPDHLFRIIL